ncbi:MAG: hypothetical protein EPN85_09475 [Bacteroidetes bacterium]|nr:MAG: hypothetical protein EPN85_09475 [Bacteroidota bacterium]
MYSLSDEQIDFILRDIKSRGVEMEDLQISLLDHICCIIENELEPGGDFESFYRKTISRFFKKELREIEEETILLLTFKNYYTMRKVMIITGATSVVGFTIGSFFKIMHWPGANILLLLGIAVASMVFLPLYFILKTKETNSKRDKIILGVGVVFGMLVSISTLFKVLHWPHSNIMWLVSLGILFFAFIPIYFFSGIRNPETKMNTITSSILLMLAGGLLFTLTSLRSDILNSFTFPDNLIKSMNVNIAQNNSALYAMAESDSNNNNKVLRVKELSEEMSNYISNLKIYLLTSIDPDLKNLSDSGMKFNQMSYKDNMKIPTEILVGLDPEHPCNGAYSASELKDKITAYRTTLLSLLDETAQKEVNNYIGLKTGDISDSDYDENWETYYFYHNPIVGVLTTLDQFKNEVSYAELVTLTKLVK